MMTDYFPHKAGGTYDFSNLDMAVELLRFQRTVSKATEGVVPAGGVFRFEHPEEKTQ